MKPSIGRIVHYRFSNRYNDHVDLPAIVTAVNEDGSVNLCVFGDSETAETTSGTIPKTKVKEFSGQGNADPNTWHWPEREGSSGERSESSTTISGAWLGGKSQSTEELKKKAEQPPPKQKSSAEILGGNPSPAPNPADQGVMNPMKVDVSDAVKMGDEAKT